MPLIYDSYGLPQEGQNRLEDHFCLFKPNSGRAAVSTP
jgi:hypothetical protein